MALAENSTIPLTWATDGPSAYLVSALGGFINSHSPELECAFRLALFAPFLGKTFSLTRPKQARIRRFPYLPMVVHVLSAPLQFVRYYGTYIRSREPPIPDYVDLMFSGLFILTSALLITSRARRHSNITRTVFQATILQHAAVFMLGYWWTDARLFGLSVKFLNLFSWFRAVHRVLPRLLPMRFRGPGKYIACYDAAIVVGTFVSLWEVGYPAGSGIFAGLVALLIWVERSLALRMAKHGEQNLGRRLLIGIGMMDFEVLTGKDPEAVTPEMWKKAS